MKTTQAKRLTKWTILLAAVILPFCGLTRYDPGYLQLPVMLLQLLTPLGLVIGIGVWLYGGMKSKKGIRNAGIALILLLVLSYSAGYLVVPEQSYITLFFNTVC